MQELLKKLFMKNDGLTENISMEFHFFSQKKRTSLSSASYQRLKDFCLKAGESVACE